MLGYLGRLVLLSLPKEKGLIAIVMHVFSFEIIFI